MACLPPPLLYNLYWDSNQKALDAEQTQHSFLFHPTPGPSQSLEKQETGHCFRPLRQSGVECKRAASNWDHMAPHTQGRR